MAHEPSIGGLQVHFAGCTFQPTGEWMAQQARNLVSKLQDGELRASFLLRDRDSKFTASFEDVFRSEAIEVIRLPYRSPRANSCEFRRIRTPSRLNPHGGHSWSPPGAKRPFSPLNSALPSNVPTGVQRRPNAVPTGFPELDSPLESDGVGAYVAQSAEHFLGKEEVSGSNPDVGSNRAILN